MARLRGRTIALVLGVATLLALAGGVAAQGATVADQVNLKRGVVVLLDDANGANAIALARSTELLLYVQMEGDAATAAARKAAEDAGLLGARVWVEKGAFSSIHIATDLADVVALCSEAAKAAPKEELLRVLRPGGRIAGGGSEAVKPAPEGTDDWSHPGHDPSNNPVSSDTLARWPFMTQFCAEPYYGPNPAWTVASGGRIFKILGNYAHKPREQPWMNTLLAMNGYNGTLLWKRELNPDFLADRFTFAATPGAVYLADDKSCKVIDSATGEVKDEIVPPVDKAHGTVWNWMAIDAGVLYAMMGNQDPACPPKKVIGYGHGWNWTNTPAYNKPWPYGFGRTILAIDLADKKVLWTRAEADDIDGRAVCMKGGRIYYYSPGKLIGCLDAKTGQRLWTNADKAVCDLIGPDSKPPTPGTGFMSTVYLMAGDRMLYFAGPHCNALVAIDAADGHKAWSIDKTGNYRLVIRPDALYALSTGVPPTGRFDALTGKSLGPPNYARGACTRITANVDAVFYRGKGTAYWQNGVKNPYRVLSCMRPACDDGVVFGNGMAYWGPWMCDCNYQLVGVIALHGLALAVVNKPDAAERLEIVTNAAAPVAFDEDAGDWPAYRHDNRRSAVTSAPAPDAAKLLWTYAPPGSFEATAPIVAGGKVYAAWSDGSVRALSAADGKPAWTFHAGNGMKFPPSVWKGRAYIGGGDGWVYCLEAATGRALWRFRAAPAERLIPFYGALESTWPVCSGVAVEDGVAYAAAGIASHDGAYVYALDAATGKLKWHNSDSGMGVKNPGAGVSVQGDLLIQGGKLYLAGGNVCAGPAVYALADGAFGGKYAGSGETFSNGKELTSVAGQVFVSGPQMCLPEENPTWHRVDFTVESGGVTITQGHKRGMIRRVEGPYDPEPYLQVNNGFKEPKVVWEKQAFGQDFGFALAPNALLAVGQVAMTPVEERAGKKPEYALVAFAVADGREMWRAPLDGMPKVWGIAVDRAGKIYVSLKDGRVLCFGR